MRWLTTEKVFAGRQQVEYQSQGEDADGQPQRQVFSKHDQVIPEVEVYFLGVAFGEGAPANMVNDSAWATAYIVPFSLQAPAQVDLFHMGMKITVKTTHLME